MQLITKDYLLDIVQRKISVSIQVHRRQHFSLVVLPYTHATKAEVYDFILSIPYFDTRLKNFLTAPADAPTFITQAWETEFVKKCECWVNSYEWMYGKHYPSTDGRAIKGSLSLLF